MVQAVPKFVIKPGYRAQSEDCSVQADMLDFWLLRQRSPEQRLAMGASMNRSARQFSINCFRKRFSQLTPQQFVRKLAEAWLQEDCPPGYIPDGNEMTWVQDSIALASQLHAIFTAVYIPYYITGGVAAIAYGEPRTTRDLDVVLSVQLTDIQQLAKTLEESGFYVTGVDDVLSGRMTTLQITHQETISRADLIVAGTSAFDTIKFERRQSYMLPDGTKTYLASPEDVIINKLRWGKRSQSEKQWRDVLGVMKVQGEQLDFDYLTYWATELDLTEDLHRALRESGLSEGDR